MKRSVTAALLSLFLASALIGCGQANVKLTYSGGEPYRAESESSPTAATDSADNDGNEEYARYAALNDEGYSYQIGAGVEQSYEKAVECYRVAAEHGIPEAITNLGFCYERALGVEQDYKRAVELYTEAAALGNSAAMNNLGWCYEQGLGVQQSYKTAYEWYSRAAKCGSTLAQENLQYLKDNGLTE